MKLKDILGKKGAEVFAINADMTLKEAVDQLIKHSGEALIVKDHSGKLLGILSERDIVKECHKTGFYGQSIHVRDVMSKKVITADAETGVDEAILQMFLNQIRHLPVTVRGKLEGIITAQDVFLANLTRSQEENSRFRQFMTSSFDKMKGKKVLIVDEDPEALSLFETVFTACGVTILKSQNGDDCLRKILADKPDLIILSDLLPGLSGYDVAEKLRQSPEEIKKIPVIVMASQPSMGSLFRDLGIEHFLSKPVSPYILLKHAEAIFHYGQEILGPISPKNYVVGAGIQQYEMEQIRSFLRSFALTTDLYSSEEECLNVIRRNRPKFVFVFFWEESDKFNAAKIYLEMQKDPKLRTVPFVCFCQGASESSCLASGLKNPMIVYEHVDDLMKGFVKFLRDKVVPH